MNYSPAFLGLSHNVYGHVASRKFVHQNSSSYSSELSSKCNLSNQVPMDEFNPENSGATGTSEF